MPLLASPCLLFDFPVLVQLYSLAQVSEQDRTTSSSEGARGVAAKSASRFQAQGRLIIFSVQTAGRYPMLCEFFNVITSVISLLRMRGKSSTLANICPKIQSLTDRRFIFYQLAQLKYIMPEVILVKRIHVRDERTDCMKEELFITLDMEAKSVASKVSVCPMNPSYANVVVQPV